MRYPKYLFGIALSALIFTEAGESSDAPLRASELPVDIVGSCAASGVKERACTDANYRLRSLGRTGRGELYLVERAVCAPQDCRAWLIVREGGAVARTLLTVTGELELDGGRNRFPAVRARDELGDSYTRYSRFEWHGGEYVRTETRLVHRIDDLECTDVQICDVAARDALQRDQTDRAVRIWQQVHGIDWI